MSPELVQGALFAEASDGERHTEEEEQSQSEEEHQDGTDRSASRKRGRAKRQAPTKRKRGSGSLSETDSEYEKMMTMANAAKASKEKNREAQRRFRARQKDLITALKDQVAGLEAELSKVRYESQNLKKTNQGLQEQLREAEVAKIKAEARADVKTQIQGEIAAAARAALASVSFPGQSQHMAHMQAGVHAETVQQEAPADDIPKAGKQQDSPREAKARQRASPSTCSDVLLVAARHASQSATSDGQPAPCCAAPPAGPASENMCLPQKTHTSSQGLMAMPPASQPMQPGLCNVVRQHTAARADPGTSLPMLEVGPGYRSLNALSAEQQLLLQQQHQQQRAMPAPPKASSSGGVVERGAADLQHMQSNQFMLSLQPMESSKTYPETLLTARQSNNNLGLVQIQAVASGLPHTGIGGMSSHGLQGMTSGQLQGMSSMGLGGLGSMCLTNLGNMGGASVSLSTCTPTAMQQLPELQQTNGSGLIALDCSGQYSSILSSMVQQAMQQQQQQQQVGGMGLSTFSQGNNMINGHTALLQPDIDAMRQQTCQVNVASMPSSHCIQLTMPGSKGFGAGRMPSLKVEQCLPTAGLDLAVPRAMA